MNRKNKIRLLLAGGAGLALVALVWFSHPGHSVWLPKCPAYMLLGLYCPGCGNTRALHAFLHGDILLALRNNLLFFPGGLLVALLILHPQWALNRTLTKVLLIVLILFTVLRNIPVYPFTLLAPVPAS